MGSAGCKATAEEAAPVVPSGLATVRVWQTDPSSPSSASSFPFTVSEAWTVKQLSVELQGMVRTTGEVRLRGGAVLDGSVLLHTLHVGRGGVEFEVEEDTAAVSAEAAAKAGHGDAQNAILAELETAFDGYVSSFVALTTDTSYFSLSLDREFQPLRLATVVQSSSVTTLGACLSAFIALEALSGDNAVHCSACRRKTSASKRLALWSLPDVMVIHLKRFTQSGTKLGGTVQFPLRGLSMAPALHSQSPMRPEDCLYDCFAVCNHFGTESGGHYTAYVHPGTTTAGDEADWMECNDTFVTPVAAGAVVSSAAYILFYVRRPSSGGNPARVGWACTACTFVNEHQDAPVCEACGTARDDGGDALGGDSDAWQGPTGGSEVSWVGHAGPPLHGLANFGNTCFLNSALQCLAACPPLVAYLASSSFRGDLRAAADAAKQRADAWAATGGRGPPQHPQHLTTALGEVALGLVGRGLPPRPQAVKTALEKLSSQFEGSDQHDAQEVVIFLLAALHDQLNTAVTIPPALQAAVEAAEKAAAGKPLPSRAAASWEWYTRLNTSVVVRQWQGQLASETTCVDCDTTSTRFDPWMFLSVPVAGDSGAPAMASLPDVSIGLPTASVFPA